MKPPRISVIICTHNPRKELLARTLECLRAQSLPVADWELLIVDNASREPVALTADQLWHPAARVLVEAEVGVTAARLRGISEARAELIVFVDDDNLLIPQYLERAASLAQGWPMLGVWGCGIYQPDWEVAPPAGFAEYIKYLAVHAVPRDRWSNQLFDYGATPLCAGMCVRIEVARQYSENVRRDSRRKLLGRAGANLTGCEDFDLAFTAIDRGQGIGVFRELAMTHVIPRFRIEESYLLRLIEGHFYSTVLLHYLRDPSLTPPRGGLIARIREFRLQRALSPIVLKIHAARRRGEARGWALVASLSSTAASASPG